MSSRMTSVSGVYPYCKWDLDRWHNDFRVWTVSELEVDSWIWMRNRMASVSWSVSSLYLIAKVCMSSGMTDVYGMYPCRILTWNSEWVSERRLCLERIWIVSRFGLWMSIWMASVSRAYPYYIWKLNLNEYQNGIRFWSVSALYLISYC